MNPLCLGMQDSVGVATVAELAEEGVQSLLSSILEYHLLYEDIAAQDFPRGSKSYLSVLEE